jgi:hypothetical protein
MNRYVAVFVPVFALFCLGAAGAHAQQYPILDRIAAKVVEKYETSSCQQIAYQRAHPRRGPQEARAVEMLRQNPGMRQAFINRVAAPIANKLFECGLIP